MEEGKKLMDTATVTARLEQLRGVVAQGKDLFDPYVLQRAERELGEISGRLEAGLGLTVAALAGGTGSGKSTLFNALTELNFADAGDVRPTTMDITACVWSAAARPVLEALGVKPERTISHNSLLSSSKRELDSLVLLDLPDHDSVSLGNSALVNRILPLVDVLVWVLDPQKYADHLIHDSYIAAMRERADRMIVVLNQIDTLPEGGTEAITADIRKLLRADGIADSVPIFPVSALHRRGLEPLRDALKKAAGLTNAALETTGAYLDEIGARLGEGLEAAPVHLEAEKAEEIARGLSVASGVPAVAEAIAGVGWHARAVAPPEQPAAAVVDAHREAWLAHASSGLPQLWARRVDEQVSDAASLRRAIGGALRAVPVRAGGRGALLGGVLAGILLAAACIGAGVAAVAPWWAAALGAVVAVLCGFALGWWARRRSAAARARAYQRAVNKELGAVVEKHCVAPAREVLDQYARVRQVVRGE